MKIMVLDDNAEIISMLTMMIYSAYGRENCEVFAGRNGEDGLALLKDNVHPDVILTNLRMPLMDGLTFISEVRHNTAWNDVRLVMMSALSTSDVVNAATASGAEAFLRKPFTYQDLKAVLDNFLFA